jgi:hypothetical protein
VVGDVGTILKTTDGGAIWTSQRSGTTNYLESVLFPANEQTGYAVGWYGTILKTTDGGGTFVEQEPVGRLEGLTVGRLKITPNPFFFFTTIPGQEGKRFEMYDVLGRRVGVYDGDRVGWDLGPGVYFLCKEGEGGAPGRVVKIR